MRRRLPLSSLLLVASMGMGMTACSGALRYTPVPQIMREADPVIIADINKGQGITYVDIKIEHLGPPDRVNPNLTHYVAFARRNTSVPWQRLGALSYNKDARRGELVKAQIGETAFELLVTTEASNQPTEPTTSNTIVVQQVGTAQ